MGDETDKKPPAKATADQGNDQDQGKGKNAAANADGAVREGVDLRELEQAYDKAGNAENVLFNKRAIGIREVLNALNEADPPNLADDLMKGLIIAGLGFATGGISAAIAGKLVTDATATVLNNAVQTALDDGLKDAATKIAGRLAQPGGDSKSEFFASQEEGLESLRLTALDTITDKKKAAGDRVLAADQAKRGEVLGKETKGAETFRKGVTEQADQGRAIQFRESLTKYLNAVSRGAMGNDTTGGNTGTNLFGAKGVKGRDPGDFYRHQGAGGVIYAAFGSRSFDGRPFGVSGGGTGFGQIPTLKVSGMTQSAAERLKGVPIKDLGMPIIASGYVYEGFLDGLAIQNDNEVSFGKNEAGTVFTSGQADGWSALRKAAGKGDNASAARVILDEDIGVATLDNAKIG